MPRAQQARLFRALVLILAVVPVVAGAVGVLTGRAFPGFGAEGATADLDSHVRYLSGILFAVGLGFWACALGLGNATARFNGLALLVVAGGAGRLLSLPAAGAPSAGHLAGLGLELAVVPLLAFWQARAGLLR